MTYKQTLDYLYSRLPMFQRIGPAAYKADLSNTLELCALLGHPENKFRSIHIAGTNGKGSTSHLVASVFQEAGYKTGLYTSPHLKDFRERVRINGKMIPQSRVIRFVEEHKKDFEKIDLSFFEWTVGLAFDYFASEKVDIAIIETGLGGRLDSTNVITPELSVITNISYDHMNLLGNTLPKIAAEKAGIIKKQIPVIIGETQDEVKSVFLRKSKAEKSPVIFADTKFQVKGECLTTEFPPQLKMNVYSGKKLHIEGLRCALSGSYQKKNTQTVLAAIEALQVQGWAISEKAIRAGFRNVIKNTGFAGRWQILGKSPLIVADTGHNEAGIREVMQQLKKLKYNKLHIVFGVVNDKDPSKVLELLPGKAEWYFCKASVQRAMPAEELQEKALRAGLKGESYPTVKKALKAAKEKASGRDVIFIGGSTFVVADAL
ncbi:MAG: folylpolyglutamate synthase/dihydrofolate synthase family protein [Bacteroidia bacterium]